MKLRGGILIKINHEFSTFLDIARYEKIVRNNDLISTAKLDNQEKKSNKEHGEEINKQIKEMSSLSKDKVSAVTVDNIAPTPENISSSKYPVARSMYFYIKNAHIKEVPALKEYANLFMSEKMIGKDGILGELGLITLDDKTRDAARKKVMNNEKITLEDLKQH